jgi:hypothetical protein
MRARAMQRPVHVAADEGNRKWRGFDIGKLCGQSRESKSESHGLGKPGDSFVDATKKKPWRAKSKNSFRTAHAVDSVHGMELGRRVQQPSTMVPSKEREPAGECRVGRLPGYRWHARNTKMRLSK